MRQGELLKQQGINQVASNNQVWVEQMKAEAKHIAETKGSVCSDDLREFSEYIGEEYGIYPKHKNAWGAIFSCKMFEKVDYKKSTWPSNNARVIGVYRLAGSEL